MLTNGCILCHYIFILAKTCIPTDICRNGLEWSKRTGFKTDWYGLKFVLRWNKGVTSTRNYVCSNWNGTNLTTMVYTTSIYCKHIAISFSEIELERHL